MRNLKFLFTGLTIAIAAPTFAIFKGHDANIEDFPWHVSVRTPKDEHDCGGSIIAPNVILTAEHCLIFSVDVRRPTYGPVSERPIGAVKVGMTDHRIGEKATVPVHKTILYKHYDSFDGNDLALLVLDQCLEYGPSVQPIAIADEAQTDALMQGDSYVTAIGWGMSDYPDIYPNILQQAELKVHSHAEADRLLVGSIAEEHLRKHFGSARTPRATLFPAGGAGTDTGTKDSGGSLSYVDPASGKRLLVGVTSWGQPNRIGGYVRAAHFKPWIEKVVEKYAKRCEKR